MQHNDQSISVVLQYGTHTFFCISNRNLMLSSVTILGDVLFTLSGTVARMSCKGKIAESFIKTYEPKSVAECRLVLIYHEEKININTKKLYRETSKALIKKEALQFPYKQIRVLVHVIL